MFKDSTSYKCAKYSIANARYMLLFRVNLNIAKCLHKEIRNVTSPFMIFLPHLYIALYTVAIKDESLFKKKKKRRRACVGCGDMRSSGTSTPMFIIYYCYFCYFCMFHQRSIKQKQAMGKKNFQYKRRNDIK
jgi:hypothetical protein